MAAREVAAKEVEMAAARVVAARVGATGAEMAAAGGAVVRVVARVAEAMAVGMVGVKVAADSAGEMAAATEAGATEGAWAVATAGTRAWGAARSNRSLQCN